MVNEDKIIDKIQPHVTSIFSLSSLTRHLIQGSYDNGMKIDTYSTLEQAFRETMVEDIDHTLIRHSYSKE